MSKRLYYLFKLIFCISLFVSFIPRQAKASHAVGADLTYICTGGNNYRFFFTLYRDCAGIAVSSQYTIQGTNSCGATTVNITVNLDSTREIPHTCSTVVTKCQNINSI